MWLVALVLADRWHVPPWVIWRHPGARKWVARQAVYDEALEWKRKWDARKNDK